VSNRETDCEAAGSRVHDSLRELLAHERRRRVLACLREHGSLPLPDLATEVARREHDGALAQARQTDELCVFLALSNVHVPRLAEADVVAYDRDRNVVALDEAADAPDRLSSLESTPSPE